MKSMKLRLKSVKQLGPTPKGVDRGFELKFCAKAPVRVIGRAPGEAQVVEYSSAVCGIELQSAPLSIRGRLYASFDIASGRLRLAVRGVPAAVALDAKRLWGTDEEWATIEVERDGKLIEPITPLPAHVSEIF